MHRFPALVFAAACTPAAPPFSPTEGPASGYAPLTLDLDAAGVDPDVVHAVHVGGRRALAPEPTDAGLVVTLQGGPPGDAPVVLTLDDGSEVTLGAFTYLPPVDPLFDRMVALGASLTQGTADGTPNPHSQLASPAAVVARQAGADFPIPLLAEGLFPRMGIDDVGPAPACATPDPVDFIASGIFGVIEKLVDPVTGQFDYRRARQDPDLMPANVASGGFLIRDIVYGPDPGAVPQEFLGHVSFEPTGDFTTPLATTQLERVEALDPTIVLVTDLYGNDVILPFVGKPADADDLTPMDAFEAALEEGLARLAATGAEVFVANLPRVTFSSQALGKEGPDLDAIVAAGIAFNARLDAEAARYDNVHVVDAFGWVEELPPEGLVIGEHTIGRQRFGGLVSLDGVHFTDTGYALFADLFVTAIAEVTGVEVPRPDLAAIAEQDDRSPRALRAAGLDIDACAAD